MKSPNSPLLKRVTFLAPATDGGTVTATRSRRAVTRNHFNNGCGDNKIAQI
jgi:hypothetical protein